MAMIDIGDGVQLDCDVTGDRRANASVLLLRRLGGTMALWGPFAEHLGRELEVITFDPRGVGRSTEAPLFHSTRRSLYGIGLAAARHDAESALRKIAAPTLILVGELDPVAGRRSQAELVRDIRHERFEVIAGAGHDLSLEQPETLAKRVLEFVRRPASIDAHG